MNKEIIEKARLFAIEKHKGQEYSCGMPYTFHLEQTVANLANLEKAIRSEYLDGFYEQCVVVAWLHDVLEDTQTTQDEIVKEFGLDIYNNLKVLTREKGMLYFDYIMRIINYDVCSIVKYADLTANINAKDEGDGFHRQRKEKYLLARELIAKSMLYESSFSFHL